MPRHLPSMQSLRVFEATARHLSFTRAATELNLTQGAISHQIKKLEDLIGVQLFLRENNAISLTEAARDYLEPARRAITELQVATDRAIGRQRANVLTVACLGTFSLKCLLPNLPDFCRRHPEIGLQIRTLVPGVHAAPRDFDVSIQYGKQDDWPGMVARKIADEELFPVCAPSLLKSGRGLVVPSDLAHLTVIRTASPLILRDDWPLWLEKAGIPGMSFVREISCDLLYPSYQAAIEGLGVAMGRSAVVLADIASGRLTEPFAIRLPSVLGYHLVAEPARMKLPKVEAFGAWALDCLTRAANPCGALG